MFDKVYLIKSTYAVTNYNSSSCLETCSGILLGGSRYVVFSHYKVKMSLDLEIICTFYGVQMNSFGSSVPEANLLEIHGMIAGWLESGYNVVWGGDQNLSVGTELLPGNEVTLSPCEELFNEFIKRYDLNIVNSLSEDPTSHTDLRTKKTKPLI